MRRLWSLVLVAVLACSWSGEALSLHSGQRAAVFSNKNWQFPGSTIDVDFTRDRVSTKRQISTTFSTTRSSTKFCDYIGSQQFKLVNNGELCYTNKGALIEEQRINLIPNSASSNPYFPGAADNLGVSSTDLGILFPGVTIVKSTRGTLGDNNIYAIPTVITGWAFSTTYAVSIYVYIPSTTTLTSLIFTIEGTAGNPFTNSTLATADNAKRDQWQRLVGTTTSGASGAVNPIPVVRFTAAAGQIVYVTAPQFEAGAFATSFIASSGGAGTRFADSVRTTIPNIVSALTLYGQAVLPFAVPASTFPNAVALDDNTFNEIAELATNNSLNHRVTVRSLNATQWDVPTGGAIVVGAREKWAIAVAAADYASAVNGAIGATQASGLFPVVNQLQIGARASGVGPYNGYIERTAVWVNNRQSNAFITWTTTP